MWSLLWVSHMNKEIFDKLGGGRPWVGGLRGEWPKSCLLYWRNQWHQRIPAAGDGKDGKKSWWTIEPYWAMEESQRWWKKWCSTVFWCGWLDFFKAENGQLGLNCDNCPMGSQYIVGTCHSTACCDPCPVPFCHLCVEKWNCSLHGVGQFLVRLWDLENM